MRTSSWGIAAALVATVAGGLALAGKARADVVYLEGGGRVRGEIISETPQQVVVKTPTGAIVVKRDEIARIERDRNPEQEYQERAKKIADGDAAGWFELGKWASAKGLKEPAEAAYRKAIAFDPEHAGAREALGYRKYNGKWYDDVSYKKAVEGLVEYKGRWVTPDEREKLEQGFTRNDKGEWVRAEDLARQEAEKKAAEERARQAAAGKKSGAGGSGGGGGDAEKPKEPGAGAATPGGGSGGVGETVTRPGSEKPAGSGGATSGGKKVKEIEPEDDSWYDDHTVVRSWDDALKQPYESRFYKIYSNIKPEYVKRYGLMMDVYNLMGFQRVFNAAANLQHGFPKGSIYIYPNQEEFKRKEQMGDGVGGFYQPGQNRVVCYHGRFGQTGTTRTVLVHEGTHQFEDFVIPGKMWNAPVWIIEGFAVFFESAHFDRKAAKVDIGHIPHDRLANLKHGLAANNYIHLPELIRTPQPQFTGYHYAHAWSLIYFLVYSGKTEAQRHRRQKIFSDLFFLAQTKKVTPEDVEALWGGPDKFAAWEEEWKQWLLDLPYDWDPKEGLEGGEARKDPNPPAPKPEPPAPEPPKPETPKPPEPPKPESPGGDGDDD
ncbi:MAG TPA: DUF1570 domain-containing protein [Planctomycetota bacterium]|nr:DUF1570 domain-containing protein [Planctomycetota bacterium]